MVVDMELVQQDAAVFGELKELVSCKTPHRFICLFPQQPGALVQGEGLWPAVSLQKPLRRYQWQRALSQTDSPDPKTNEVSSGYRESGYLPEAFINMLAFLGWNPGTEQEFHRPLQPGSAVLE